MAFMQLLIASSRAASAAAVAFSMLTRICSAADAEVIGANVSDRAIRIARIARRRCSGSVLQR